jgi:hypothetical protein
MIVQAGKKSSPTSTDPAAGLPAADETHDREPPHVVDASTDDERLGQLARGRVIVVFARLGTPEGAETARLAAELHRRLRGWQERYAQVVLVVPRGEPGRTHAELGRVGLAAGPDLTIVLDPDGRLRRARGIEDVNAAVFLDRGGEVLRVRPPGGTTALTLAHVRPLVLEVVARAPSVAPDEHQVPN